MPLQPGTALGLYEIQSQLGAGWWIQVFLKSNLNLKSQEVDPNSA